MSVPSIVALERLEGVQIGPPLPPQLDVSTDSRTVGPGQTFLALTGERFDGHAYVAAAVARGAAAAIVARAEAVPPGTPALVVGDTLAAYMQLAALARDAWDGLVVAITGSTGKTTTKTFVAQLLAASGRAVAATPRTRTTRSGSANSS